MINKNNENECIFCKIAKKEIPSNIIFEDESIMAFLDINPANYGHVLVIPKEHYNNILDIDEEVLTKIIIKIKEIAEIIAGELEPDGINILQSNNKAAGQEIYHIHFHIIPRWNNDDIEISWTGKKYEKKQIEDLTKTLKELLTN